MDTMLGAGAAAAFARDGVACVRSVLEPAEVAVAADAIDAVLASPGPLAQVASGPEDPGAFTEDFRRWQQVPGIERLARHSRVPALAAALMGTAQVRFYHDHVLVKEGDTRQRTRGIRTSPTTTLTAAESAPGSRSIRCRRMAAWSWWPARITAPG
jgi:hypothetical protein